MTGNLGNIFTSSTNLIFYNSLDESFVDLLQRIIFKIENIQSTTCKFLSNADRFDLDDGIIPLFTHVKTHSIRGLLLKCRFLYVKGTFLLVF